jgi:undecaprenyl-diphosphatase
MPRFRRWRVEFEVLLALLVVAGGMLAFALLGRLVEGSEPHAFDRAILLSLRTAGDPADPLGPPWLEEAVRDVTALGSTVVLVLLVVFAVLFFAFSGRGADAVFVLFAAVGGQLLSSWLKVLIDRPRPDVVPHAAEVFTLSFPSGHAMLSAVTYLTLGSMLARVVEGRVLKAYVMTVAVLLTVLVGLSRLYLGVHWPSDVLAGWCLGAAWAMLCWLGARWLLSPRRPGESPVDSAEPEAESRRT